MENKGREDTCAPGAQPGTETKADERCGLNGRHNLISFMKIGTGVQAILRFCLRNLTGCNVGITDERDFLITPLRWAQVPLYTYQVS
jgi:hypothetical protein